MTNLPQQPINPVKEDAGASTEFEEQDYLEMYPDVAELVRNGSMTAKEHWLRRGSKEGRQGRKSPGQFALEAESLHTETEHAATRIGEPPPAPPTLRASIGAAVVRIVRPMFAWYTHAFREYAGKAHTRDRSVLRALRSLARETDELRIRLRDAEELAVRTRSELKRAVEAELAGFHSRGSGETALSVDHALTERLTSLESAQMELRKRLETAVQNAAADGARMNVLRQDVARLNAEIGRVQTTVTALDGQMRTVAQQSRDAVIEEITKRTSRMDAVSVTNERDSDSDLAAQIEQQNDRLWEVGKLVQELREHARASDARMSILLRELRRTTGKPVDLPQRLSRVPAEFETLVASFEDVFRGSREEIKARQQVYLPVLKSAGAGSSDMPVVDLGCGRGEWVQLLHEHGLTGRGVDSNPDMIARCHEAGLDASEADVIGYLRGLPDNSVGAVTSFHLVEHLPFDDVLVLLSESLRVLKPNGVLLLETPNPNNLMVGARNFYMDPTHRHPLPPPLMKFVTEAAGFSDVGVQEVNPFPDSLKLPDSPHPAVRFINDNFFGPQDYAVIARKFS